MMAAALDPPGEECRDRFLWPFAAQSIWNTPLGANATYEVLELFPNKTVHGGHGLPTLIQIDPDTLVRSSASDPLTPWFNQGGWSNVDH